MRAQIGERFGKAEVVEIVGKRFLARCDCGAARLLSWAGLRRAQERPDQGCMSCGRGRQPKIGDRFGSREVVDTLGIVDGLFRVRVRCDCGSETVLTKTDFWRRPRCRGCVKGAQNGWARSPEYAAWCSMHARCQPVARQAKHYYQRGITVCQEWQVFESFLRDVGRRPGKGYTLDREDNARGYEPGNVRWVPWSVQNRNKRWNVNLTHGEETMCLSDWARRIGLTKASLKERLERGWSIEEALTTPPKKPTDKRKY